MKADGTKTDISTSAIAISARADFVHALDRRLARRQAPLDVALDILHHDDGVIDDDADGEHQAKQRQDVEREPEDRHREKRADQRHRNGDNRNDRARQVCRNRITTSTTSRIASPMVCSTASTDCWMNCVGL